MLNRKYAGIGILIFIVAAVSIAYAQIATSCIPDTASPWCVDGLTVKLKTGNTSVTLPATVTGTNNSIPDAMLSANVSLLNGTQTISAIKTFSANPVFNTNAIADAALSTNVPLLNGTAAFTTPQTVPTLVVTATAFASLGAPANGTFKYCNDCTVAVTCAGAGTGALAKRLNGGWRCD